MESNNIVITGKERVELRREDAPVVPNDGLLVRTSMSLISSGTESICFRGDL